MKNLSVHMIIKNEERWVWYALQSVLPYVERIIVYDTGSVDKTIPIIKTVASPKIKLALRGGVSPKQLVELRNEQLQQTKTNWFMLLDGDEVWTKAAIEEAVDVCTTAPSHVTALVSPTVVPVGDLRHFQSNRAGQYNIQNHKGHFNIRFYRRREKYMWRGIYPLEAYCDEKEQKVQDKEKEILFLNQPYWHMTHLVRSTHDSHKKRKLEIGQKGNVAMPEVFTLSRPAIVPPPTANFSLQEKVIASILTPLLQLKRTLF